MKKAVSIFAVLVMTIAMFTSCEDDSRVETTDALYDINVDASRDDEQHETEGRDED